MSQSANANSEWDDRLQIVISGPSIPAMIDQSLDLEVSIRNIQTSAQLVLSPKPLNDAVRWLVLQPHRGLCVGVADDLLRARRGQPSDSHREPETEILEPGTTCIYTFDLLQYGLDLAAGPVEITALFPDDGLESNTLRFELGAPIEPERVTHCRAHDAWWDPVQHQLRATPTGTFIRGCWAKIPRFVAYDRKIWPESLPANVSLSRPCTPGRTLRHLCWTAQDVHFLPVDEGRAAGPPRTVTVRGPVVGFLEDPEHRLWAVRRSASGSGFVVSCLSDPHTRSLEVSPTGPPGLVDAGFDRYGRLHLTYVVGPDLVLFQQDFHGGAPRHAAAVRTLGRMPGTCKWLAMELEPFEAGDDVELAPTVLALIEQPRGALEMWVSTAYAPATRRVEVHAPPGRIVDLAYDRHGGLHLLVANDAKLEYVGPQGHVRPIEIPRARSHPDQSQLVIASDPDHHAVFVTTWDEQRGTVLCDVTS
ncbi:MAG: hypothetical protein V3V08_16120 [Nannocystaceae bacterium]